VVDLKRKRKQRVNRLGHACDGKKKEKEAYLFEDDAISLFGVLFGKRVVASECVCGIMKGFVFM
jgi:hypothetical protein